MAPNDGSSESTLMDAQSFATTSTRCSTSTAFGDPLPESTTMGSSPKTLPPPPPRVGVFSRPSGTNLPRRATPFVPTVPVMGTRGLPRSNGIASEHSYIDTMKAAKKAYQEDDEKALFDTYEPSSTAPEKRINTTLKGNEHTTAPPPSFAENVLTADLLTAASREALEDAARKHHRCVNLQQELDEYLANAEKSNDFAAAMDIEASKARNTIDRAKSLIVEHEDTIRTCEKLDMELGIKLTKEHIEHEQGTMRRALHVLQEARSDASMARYIARDERAASAKTAAMLEKAAMDYDEAKIMAMELDSRARRAQRYAKRAVKAGLQKSVNRTVGFKRSRNEQELPSQKETRRAGGGGGMWALTAAATTVEAASYVNKVKRKFKRSRGHRW